MKLNCQGNEALIDYNIIHNSLIFLELGNTATSSLHISSSVCIIKINIIVLFTTLKVFLELYKISLKLYIN